MPPLIGRAQRVVETHRNVADEKTTASIHSALTAGFVNGTLSPVIGKEIPLQKATRAHQEILQPGSFGKIVLIP